MAVLYTTTFHVIILPLVAFLVCFTQHSFVAPEDDAVTGLLSCLSRNGVHNFTSIQSPYFSQLLDFSSQNFRFVDKLPKPVAVILPMLKEDVQKSVVCSLDNKLELRIRSGGHSYEGLSYTADAPFVVIDFMNLHSVKVDLQSETAWVDAGATIGEVYYEISKATSDFGFSAGTCPTLGSGGHLSGGGFGMLSRKYGVAADNVVDAQLVDGRGNILDRTSMGEDLFWALRGGGGGSWGIVVSWKIKLVPVPRIVTVFSFERFGKQRVTQLVYKWQTVAPAAPDALMLAIYVNGFSQGGNKDVRGSFYGQYLGRLNETLSYFKSTFPELGVNSKDFEEVPWIKSVLRIAGLSTSTDTSILAKRFNPDKHYFKAKSDYVTRPMAPQELQGALNFLEENTFGDMIFEPYGGIMARIPSKDIAFPHRAGNLFVIQYQVVWSKKVADESSYIGWLRRLYSYMTPFVSKNPRAAYVNYVDLDLGSSAKGNGSVEQARTWGYRYFLQNFDRLVVVKSRVDPQNIFRDPQSIPPDPRLSFRSKCPNCGL